MKSRNLGAGLGAVSAIGLGCMGMSEFYGPSNKSQSLATLEYALDKGINFFDTADTYGLGHNEELLSSFLARHRDEITLATKFGIVRDGPLEERRIDNTTAYMIKACEASLKRLGIETIDLYYAHRLNPAVPIEDTVGAMAELVKQGKVRGLGLSEVSPATLRRAHAIYPIAAVQSEYSLWTRDPEDGILQTCKELGVAFIPYSPLGRGFLTGNIRSVDDMAADDFRRTSQPRFEGDNLQKNLSVIDALTKFSDSKGCTPAQLALAWVLAQGEHVIPIPGTRTERYIDENIGAGSLSLTEEDISILGKIAPNGTISGDRYTTEGMQHVNI
ncbi:aldo/keto reductase [Shewanella frigidimarina]|uniref:aldo/keto reductase n=1 Tax=Shewanella frigidimarina TaxID=56812 RepID=UPI003D7AF450